MSKKLIVGALAVVLGLSSLFTSCNAISSVESSLHIGTIATSQSVSWTGQANFNGTVTEGLNVTIKPTSKAKPDVQYTVDLYESGEYRATQTVSWDDTELSTFTNKDVLFPSVSDDEVENYIIAGKNLMDVYTIKVYATVIPSTTTNSSPIITVTYPKGGETFRVGQVITVTWKTTNLSNTAEVNVGYTYPSGYAFFHFHLMEFLILEAINGQSQTILY